MSGQGNQTLVVAGVTENLAQLDRKRRPAAAVTLTKVRYCSLQPVSVTETEQETDYARIMWRALMPAEAAVLTVSTAGQLYYDDLDPVTGVKALTGKATRITADDPETGTPTDYAVLDVIGSELFYDDNSGMLDHVTITAKTEVG